MGKGGFGKGKYKKIIKSIYPLTPDGDVQVHNIGKLVHFCQISPTKLIKVARYVEKKTNSDLTKSKLRFVGASMKIFQDLIKGCRKNLNLFSNNILRLMKILLEGSFPELKILATETFIQFTEVLDENTPYPELEGLITYFIDMCQNQIRDSRIKTRLKQDGLKGIRSYIRVLEMADELDGFIARHSDNDNWAVLLPAILDNLTFLPSSSHNSDDNGRGIGIGNSSSGDSNASDVIVAATTAISAVAVDGVGPEEAKDAHPSHTPCADDVDRESVHTLATEVLRDIFSRANISVTSMFKAILRYLEVKNRWVPNTFAVHCVQSIFDCLKVQHGQILITLLLQHAEQAQHSITVKAQIFNTMVQFFTESTGYFMQILDSLIKHLVSSVEFTSQDQLVISNANAHLTFQDDMIMCLGLLCAKISHPQKLDAFSAVCARLSQSKHVSSSGLSGVVVIFARAILQITLYLQTFPMELLSPYLRLFQELSLHSNNDVRVFVQKIFQGVLLPSRGKPIEHLIQMARSSNLGNLGMDDGIPEQVASTIRGTLYFQIKMRMKQAENYVAIFDTLKIMLCRGGKYELVESFSLVFSIQKFASKWKKIPPTRAYTIHALVSAYLYCVALIFQCKPLEFHIDQVLQDREKKGQQCSVVTLQKSPIPALLLPATNEYSHAPQKKVAVEYILFERQTIVDMLCAEGGSIISNEKRFSKALMKKFKQQTDTLTLRVGSPMASSESTHFPFQPLSSSPATPTNASTNINNEMEPINSSSSSISSSSISSIDPQQLPAKPVPKAIIFSPESGSGTTDDLEKMQLKNSKIDVMSMKRALGVPAIFSSPVVLPLLHRHIASFDTTANSCQQKAIDDQKLLVTVLHISNPIKKKPSFKLKEYKVTANHNNATDPSSWCVFDMDLSSALSNY